MTDHSFFSGSAIDLVPVDTPVRRVYMLRLEEYRQQVVEAVGKYKQSVMQLEARIANYNSEPDPDEKDRALQGIQLELKPHRDSFVTQVMDAVQLEDGDYRLTLTFEYRDAHSKAHEQFRTVSASRDCTFGLGSRNHLRVQLGGYAEGIAVKLLLNPELPVFLPEIGPSS